MKDEKRLMAKNPIEEGARKGIPMETQASLKGRKYLARFPNDKEEGRPQTWEKQGRRKGEAKKQKRKRPIPFPRARD